MVWYGMLCQGPHTRSNLQVRKGGIIVSNNNNNNNNNNTPLAMRDIYATYVFVLFVQRKCEPYISEPTAASRKRDCSEAECARFGDVPRKR